MNPKTVTFDDCGSIKTVEIEAGTTLAASQKPSDPYKQYNYFMYWSASKASLTAATAFDFENTPITDNITLYAIYTPELYSIEDFSATQIEIKLDDTSVFPLDDGSYAGIHISYSSDGNDDFEANNFQDIDNCKFEGYSDTGYTRYLTYSFPDTFSLAAVEKHTFKVTNNHNTEYKSKTLTEPKTAKDLKVKETADSYAKISFTSDCDG